MKISIPLLILLSSLASCKETNEDLINKGNRLSKANQHQKAIETFTEVIKRNPKLQLPYYNRGIIYARLKNYNEALSDFNKLIPSYPDGSIVATLELNPEFGDEDDRMRVPLLDVIYQRAQVKYYMDSLSSSFQDFQTLIDENYEKSNCLAWQGTLWIKGGKRDKGCECFEKAKLWAGDDKDREDADELIKTYCTKK